MEVSALPLCELCVVLRHFHTAHCEPNAALSFAIIQSGSLSQLLQIHLPLSQAPFPKASGIHQGFTLSHPGQKTWKIAIKTVRWGSAANSICSSTTAFQGVLLMWLVAAHLRRPCDVTGEPPWWRAQESRGERRERPTTPDHSTAQHSQSWTQQKSFRNTPWPVQNQCSMCQSEPYTALNKMTAHGHQRGRHHIKRKKKKVREREVRRAVKKDKWEKE